MIGRLIAHTFESIVSGIFISLFVIALALIMTLFELLIKAWKRR